MQAPKFDLIIPIVRKDLSLILDNLKLLNHNIKAQNIIFIGEEDLTELFTGIPNVKFICENNMIEGLTKKEIENIKTSITGDAKRSGWYFQQFLKMGYSCICENEYYLVWDSDTIPLKEIDFFSSAAKPYLSFREYAKYDECYSKTIEHLIQDNPIKKDSSKSFITEHMLINASIMRKLISDIEANISLAGNKFYEKIMHAVDPKYINLSGFSEFETYAAYILKNFSNEYSLRHWNNLRCGKVFIGNKPTKEQLSWISTSFSTVSIEKYDSHWIIFKVFNQLKLDKLLSFHYVYITCIPIISVLYSLRLTLRAFIKR
ncbi:DUF6492 family protein [Parabacteroides sp. FAFU027]|uniref:DUF6492 family protein n=1 Tax=Parabacteroides sp. FAFU027 TaxID=2922715 RepID=UPI001FAEE53E|nr:DUF6492 family protein [Parabacteroides sp. FAFU027]